MSTSVSGCPVTSGLRTIFGNDWLDKLKDCYTLSAGKSKEQILNDVWHALFSFTDDVRLKIWAKSKLGLTEEMATDFIRIEVPQDYATLSLSAINKMRPFMRQDMRYDEAVFLANLGKMLPSEIWSDPEKREAVMAGILSTLNDYSKNPLNKNITKEQCICDFLADNFEVSKEHSAKLYHPSMIETYPCVQPDKNGQVKLGSPITEKFGGKSQMYSNYCGRILLRYFL